MMSESVTVTVQDGTGAGRPAHGAAGKTEPGQANVFAGLNLNVPYFRTIPGLIKLAQLIFYQKETIRESDIESLSIAEEQEISEEELQQQEKRNKEWDKLNNFLKKCTDEMIDAVSFNAATNLYTNDVANLGGNKNFAACTESFKNYEEKLCLIDLKIIGHQYLLSASWHHGIDNIVACCYLSKDVNNYSLVALWSLSTPLHPMMILDCEERISTISFCPIKHYTDIIIGGSLDGKIVIWEINERLLMEIKEKKDNLFIGKEINKDHLTNKATIAKSANKAQKLTITSIQWLPTWCRINTDGNFQKVSFNSSKEQRAQFVTASLDGSIYHWSLPKILSTPGTVRSPLHLTISPIYRLIFEEPGDKVNARIPITCFNFILPKSEEFTNLNIRDEADLERFRKVFIGTSMGEVLCCSWESQNFSVDVTDREICRIQTRICAHDGIVRTMTKCPYLDDVFLTVGGRIFAIWKEDFAEGPIFHRRSSECKYGDGCWSGRSGMFVLTRLDGCFELWDLKKKSDEPVLLQTVSGQMIPYVYPNYQNDREKLLAILDGPSNLRIFIEPNERCKDEDLERIEWFEEFAWRETKRKLDFHRWQNEYLQKHPTALRRKAEREQAEVNRRHEEARERFLMEQEILAREQAERKLASRRVSKSVILREKRQKRAETILLQKKGFVPHELEEKRKPLVLLDEQRKIRARKTKEDLARADEILEKCLVREIPEAKFKVGEDVKLNDSGAENHRYESKTSEQLEDDYQEVREKLIKKLKEDPYVPRFNWKEAIKAGTERMKIAEKRRNCLI